MKWEKFLVIVKKKQQNRNALQHIQKQTENICFEVVNQNGYALQFVDRSIFD